jgi:hypothetical protein
VKGIEAQTLEVLNTPSVPPRERVPGPLVPGRLRFHRDTPGVRRIACSAWQPGYFPLLELLNRTVVRDHPALTHGTIGGRYVTDPCEAGEWHADTGDAPVRVAVTWALDDPGLKCGHEFAESGPSLSGEVVAWSVEKRRRPHIPVATPRLFVSVALYTAGQEPDLSCPILAALR